jgi:hypothetical protein
MFLHKNALSQKRSEYRPLGWKNFGECSIRLRWGSQNLGSFLLLKYYTRPLVRCLLQDVNKQVTTATQRINLNLFIFTFSLL